MNTYNNYIETPGNIKNCIYLESSFNNTIAENTLNGNELYFGILLSSSPENTLEGNLNKGIYLKSSPGNILRNNVLFDFGVDGNCVSDYIQDIDTSNSLNENPIYYIVGQKGLIFDGTSLGCLALINCDNITVKNIYINVSGINGADEKYSAFLIVNTTNSVFEKCDLEYSEYGIYLLNSQNNSFSSINMSNNCIAIGIYSSSNNQFSNNNIRYNRYYGIIINSSPENILKNNVFECNPYTFGILGNGVQDYVQDIDTTNIKDGNPIYYIIGHDGMIMEYSFLILLIPGLKVVPYL
jgi:parallel beta-helix repeat protein